MKNRGQALVEFILIMPIFLLILLAIIDFGNIFKTKYDLQNDLDLIAELYKDEKSDDYENYCQNHHLGLNITQDNQFVTIEISKKIDIKTPILNQVLKNPYVVKESMTLYEK